MRARALLVAVVFVALAACQGPTTLRWTVLPPDGGVSGAVVYHAEVREAPGGSCSGGAVRATYDVDATTHMASGSMPPTLPGGTYCFCAEARDAMCRVLAQGCVTQMLPASAEITVTLVALASPGPSPCPSSCSNGRCAGSSDGGSDMADGGDDMADGSTDMPVDDVPVIDMPIDDVPVVPDMDVDGGPPDLGPPDMGPPDMGPCTGCTSGATCEVGIASTACGSGGTSCGSCAGECAGGTCAVYGELDLSPIATFVHISSALLGGPLVASAGADTYMQRGDRTAGTAYGLEASSASIAATVVSLGASQFVTCAVTSAGELWCWGTNDYGLLGSGSASMSLATSAPTRAGTDTDWAFVDGGSSHFCAIKRNGALYCWGDNAHGQLGIAGGPFSAPARVDDGPWLDVSAGDIDTCAIKRDHTLWCWGDDTYGQVGDARTTTTVGTPTRVGADTDWITVSIEGTHACGIRGSGTSGSLYCWGDDRNGQLGVGSTSGPVTSPMSVDGLTSWTSVSAGQYHSCGLRGTTALCWGANTFGALGDGTGTTSLVPVALSGSWVAIAAGWQWSCGGQTSPAPGLYCWGINTNGVLGIGMNPATTPLVRTPTAIAM